MNIYGSTCPMCCGDLDASHPRTEAGVCRFCGCDTEASAYASPIEPRPDATASILSPFAISDLAIGQTPFRQDMAVA